MFGILGRKATTTNLRMIGTAQKGIHSRRSSAPVTEQDKRRLHRGTPDHQEIEVGSTEFMACLFAHRDPTRAQGVVQALAHRLETKSARVKDFPRPFVEREKERGNRNSIRTGK